MIGKQFLPASLFGRSLLILLLPTVLIQMVMAYVFFERHWGNVTRYMATALASEIAFLVDQIEKEPAKPMPPVVRDFNRFIDLGITRLPSKDFPAASGNDYPELQEMLRASLTHDFSVRKNGGAVEVFIHLPQETLRVLAPAKRLESPTTFILVLWMLGSTTVFLLIATVFLRNQIRPIRKLAAAADSFGRGVDMPDFRPSGAQEVRTAARAFLTMRERIKRQLRTRTEMLAGISHDLRTPLTRMKLQLAMLGDREEAKEMADDVQQMEYMIKEYLDFAAGDLQEETTRGSIKALLEDIVEDYRRIGTTITLEASEDLMADVRVTAFRRMLHNIIDNAVRYGTSCRVTLVPKASAFDIWVDDKGPGIPADKRDEVFQPFRRLDPSRNVDTGGVGLGLTIARDVALAHGGAITLIDSPEGGLRVIIHLPLTKERS